MTTDHEAMGLALDEAALAAATGDVPVGAVVLDAGGVVVGRGHNLREANGDPLAHAEVVALQDAARTLGGWRLDGATLVVTLEPCTMCAGALLAARVGRLVYGAWGREGRRGRIRARRGAGSTPCDRGRGRRGAPRRRIGRAAAPVLRGAASARPLRGVTPSRG